VGPVVNAPDNRFLLADVQSETDTRGIAIDTVGVKSVRYPFTYRSAGGIAQTIGTWCMGVALPSHTRGTHMSRFIEVLDGLGEPLDAATIRQFGKDMLARLDAVRGRVAVTFPVFIRKAAPVTGVTSLLDYEVSWHLEVHAHGETGLRMKMLVPATSLCPCSKEISEYGAHNQRSHVTVDIEVLDSIDFEELAALVERQASCELYGLLKRADEKHVTEQAYRNAKFVEDLVRDVARELEQDVRIGSYVVEAENFESIHNHSAYAVVTGPSLRTPT
jgi:GTP cyclohydrolase IB